MKRAFGGCWGGGILEEKIHSFPSAQTSVLSHSHISPLSTNLLPLIKSVPLSPPPSRDKSTLHSRNNKARPLSLLFWPLLLGDFYSRFILLLG